MLTYDAFPLRTRRLVLRPVDLGDVGVLYALYSEWEVARWLSRIPWPFTPAAAQSLVADAADEFGRRAGCALAMIEHETGAFVGVVSLRIPALEPNPWTTDASLGILGYSVVRARWGAGLASEGAGRVTSFAFEDVGLVCLRATVLRSNLASRRVLQGLGFKISEVGVTEVPRYGGPQRIGDVHVLERHSWLARHAGTSVAVRTDN